MDEIKKVCDEENITYYMVCGTLLGAVRHKGFIPWDDDLDIAMPRADFNKFISICEKKLPENLRLIWHTTDMRYWDGFAKVHNTNTVFLEYDYKNRYCETGIYVDIFPLDDAEKYGATVERQKKYSKFCFLMMREKVLPHAGSRFSDAVKRQAGNVIPNQILRKIQENILTKNNEKGFEYYSSFGSFYSIKKQTIPKSWYGKPVLLSFEGRSYNAPEKYALILERIYGKDYMQLPPEEKRFCHYPLKVSFSNGTTLYYANNTKKTYKE